LPYTPFQRLQNSEVLILFTIALAVIVVVLLLRQPLALHSLLQNSEVLILFTIALAVIAGSSRPVLD
jgi:hypothetical protein